MAELDGPVQLFSWRKLEELEVVTHAMHHGMMRRIQWPSANPTTVPGLGGSLLSMLYSAWENLSAEQ